VALIHWILVAVVSLLLSPTLARAESPAVGDGSPSPTVASNTKYEVTLDETTRWEPYHGLVRFSIAGIDGQSNAVLVETCFRWKLEGTRYALCPSPERVGNAPDGTVTFAVIVPFASKDSPAGVATESLLPLLPVANLRIRLLEPSPPTQPGAAQAVLASYVREIGITSKPISALLALVFFTLASGVLYLFARSLRIPGTNLVLRVVSSAKGWASLSQFQIVLWTLLIATGTVYVVTLTGSLLVITTGTLALLGIAGATAVGSQFQQKAVVPADTLAPAAVANLALDGNPGPNEAVLSWSPVAGAFRYTVLHSKDNGQNWVTEATALENSRFRLVDLAPATPYLVRVLATNAMGPGGAAQIAFTTAQSPPTPSNALGSILDVRQGALSASREVTLRWSPLSGATGYRLQHRPHESDRDWHPAGTVGSASARLGGLRPETDYDVRVIPFDATGDGPPSNIWRVRTGARAPQWSDLVTGDAPLPEVDVTRVQMLMFTVISAFFVALKIGESGTIPEIPSSYVTLMGISNGVYLTAKFVGR
jgi:hypothetical protein